YFERSIVLFGNDNKRYSTQPYYGCYDPLSYPLFFPRGEIGWHPEIPKKGVSLNEMLQSRRSGRQSLGLFQQYVVDMYIKVESSRLDYIKKHQEQIRADLYQGVVDSLQAGENRADEVGKRTIVPSSFIGGRRDRRRRYLDAMALVQKYGKPNIFLTMTCNPNWDEIISELEPGQTPRDRPDLIVRVFRAKLEDLKIQLFKRHIFGKVATYVYVVEFQKRGLPHAHFLLIMEGRYKLTCPEQYDCLISAELPDKSKYPELYKMVVKHMMHGPCGVLNPKNVCMQKGSCKNYYPRPFNVSTLQGKDSYPIYRRRDDGRRAKVRGQELDNRWVVPYNPYLLRRYNCHINVEVCSSIKAVKYLFKYIYKGHDRASVSIDEVDSDRNIDEIKQYRDSRWVTPPEALWRIYGFDLSQIFPSVRQLQLHLPNMHMVSFPAGANLDDVLSQEGASKTMLTEYFEANKKYELARGILYKDFPSYFVWMSGGKYWKRRDERMQIGRIVSAHPAEGERYYLRVLLNHVTGATSFQDLRTVNGIVYSTFREAAERRGLIESDNTINECLDEAKVFHMPSSLRRLFATILVFCEPSNVRGLWDRHMEAMTEDYRLTQMCPHAVEQMALLDIKNMLESMGKDISSFPLPEIDESYDASDNEAREIIEESTIEVDPEHLGLSSFLNPEQRYAYDEILATINSGQGGVFFVDGPGGTGKTYLYKALLAKVRAEGKIAVATATSGVAASILPGGRTAHSRFKIPLNTEDGGVCSFTKQSGTAKLLMRASLIIWDEASMTKRHAVEALDNSMRDIMARPDLPFGGKTIVFGGDFRQVLPVVRKGTRSQITDATLRKSYLWENMRQLRLVRNMRAQSDPWFADYLLSVGNGTEDTVDDDYIRLPDEICVPYTSDATDIDKLIESVFQMTLEENLLDPNYITSRAILSTRNEYVDKINMKMIERFPGEEMIYYSFDHAEDDPHNYYPAEFLNSLTPNGLPPHILKLKINCPIILLRNIDPASGLCNGTRLIVRGFMRNAIDAEIVLGQHASKRVFLPRIPLCPSDDEMFPFRFKRKQFPVRLSFAMTINKAQGQTIPNVGVYLPEPVFSHGQLYVALSRATSRSNMKILTVPDKKRKASPTPLQILQRT
uniref:ATP-dependent DNA helicase n=1 Tax=Aegilops tauschii subsp. strangulata TaxID=200361 RepID=A0A453CJW6_AEGTS